MSAPKEWEWKRQARPRYWSLKTIPYKEEIVMLGEMADSNLGAGNGQ